MIGSLIFGLIILASTSLWVMIEQKKNPKFLIWYIPLLLVLVTSTYVTYTSLLGLPKDAIPEQGIYLKYHVDEPNWIYLWVVDKENIPMSYRLVYTKRVHNSLEGVDQKAQDGEFMVLKKDKGEGEKGEGEEQDNTGLHWGVI